MADNDPLSFSEELEIIKAMEEDAAKDKRLEYENAVLRKFARQPGGEKAVKRSFHDREYAKQLYNYLFGG